MKQGNPANYVVEVAPNGGISEPAAQRTLYQGIYTVTLNGAMHINLVPAVHRDPPPWPAEQGLPETVLDSPYLSRSDSAVVGRPRPA